MSLLSTRAEARARLIETFECTHFRAALPPERALRGLVRDVASGMLATPRRRRGRAAWTNDTGFGVGAAGSRWSLRCGLASLCPSNRVTRCVRDGRCGRDGRHDLARCHKVDGVDGCGRTHNPSVAGSIPAGPTRMTSSGPQSTVKRVGVAHRFAHQTARACSRSCWSVRATSRW